MDNPVQCTPLRIKYFLIKKTYVSMIFRAQDIPLFLTDTMLRILKVLLPLSVQAVFTCKSFRDEMDDDNRTSEAIQVYKPSHGVIVGNQVKVSGKVTEYGAVNELTTTQITANTIVKVLDKVIYRYL